MTSRENGSTSNGDTMDGSPLKSCVTNNLYTYELLEEITSYLLERVNIRPKVGIICGSGLGSLADVIEGKVTFPYENIPHFPVSTVAGHAGRLVFGHLKGVPVICLQGRFHFYEGYPVWMCSMPVRVMKLLGVTHLIATNAAGGINQNFNVGDIMIMKDHVNMLGFSGINPLQGKNDERFGPRFPAVSKAYDAKLRAYAKLAAKKVGAASYLQEGVYAVLGGPNYETVAELKLLEKIGCDAVGMSTVHEVITAVHCGLTVFAFSLITNKCILDYDVQEVANHEEVMQSAKERESLLKHFVSQMVAHIGGKE